MFGLTKREQRWKAEQQAAESLIGLIGSLGKAAAEVRVAEAQADARELERLRVENATLRGLVARYRDETPIGHQPHMIAHLADDALGRGRSEAKMSEANEPDFAAVRRSGVLLDIDSRLMRRREEVEAALQAGDMKKLREIVLSEGLDWLEPSL